MKKSILIFMAIAMLLSSMPLGASAESKVKMYAHDGRTATVYQSAVKSWEKEGWFTYPVTIVSKDGLPYVIAENEYDKYIGRGYNAAIFNKSNILITFINASLTYKGSTAVKDYIKFRVANNSDESVYLEPRDVTAGGKSMPGAYFSPNKVPAKSVMEVTLKIKDINTSRWFYSSSFNIKVRTSSYKINERVSDENIVINY